MNTPVLGPLGDAHIVEVFSYYDGPRLYTCTDRTGALFLVAWLDYDEHDRDSWLYAPLSAARCSDICCGRVSLREAFTNAEGGVVFRVKDTGGTPVIESVPTHTLQENDLPGPDASLYIPDAA